MPNPFATIHAPEPPDLGRRLVEVLWADGEETAWDADMLMYIDEVLSHSLPGQEHTPAYAAARSLFPEADEWDTSNLQYLAEVLQTLGFTSAPH